MRAALIILITDYSECDDLSDLNGVNADGEKMEEMLTAHDFTVINTVCIRGNMLSISLNFLYPLPPQN